MTKYLVTYHGPKMPNDPAVMEKAKAAFGKWLQGAGKTVIDPGTPLMTVAHVPSEGQGPEIGGYSIIQAANLEEAIEVLKTHPFVARGGTLQLNEMVTL